MTVQLLLTIRTLKQLNPDPERLRRIVQQILDDNFGLQVEVTVHEP